MTPTEKALVRALIEENHELRQHVRELRGQVRRLAKRNKKCRRRLNSFKGGECPNCKGCR